MAILVFGIPPAVSLARVQDSDKSSHGPVIGTVSIFNSSIFDLANPEENSALYRVANRVHITTRADVVRQQLLFATGDSLSQQAIDESERILRSNRYIQDVSIDASPDGDGIVNVDVHTTDSWTLMPKVSLSRSGGENKSGIGIKESNLFGTGMAVEALYKSDVDRDSLSIKFVDKNFGDSWYTVRALYAENTDGYARFLGVEKPFYALNSKAAHGLLVQNEQRIDSLYDRGEITGQFRHQHDGAEFYVGKSTGLHRGWARRALFGLAFDRHRFSAVSLPDAGSPVIPLDRRIAYPFIAFELLQDKFEKTTNLDQVSRTEDRFLGTQLMARLGFSSAALGSDRNALLLRLGSRTGFGRSAGTSLRLTTALDTRWERGGIRNFQLSTSASFYKRQSDHRLFFASVKATFGHNLDADQQLLLGGDNGLRGYPLRYQFGDKRALVTLEQRFYSDWYPFRLFRVGGAVFFDIGRAWGSAKGAEAKNEILRDVGFGLRIGNTRSGLGRMTHIDFAFPLDGGKNIRDMQFLIQTKKSF